jgi:hypothetical protein
VIEQIRISVPRGQSGYQTRMIGWP